MGVAAKTSGSTEEHEGGTGMIIDNYPNERIWQSVEDLDCLGCRCIAWKAALVLELPVRAMERALRGESLILRVMNN